jgi:4a-hydroxytetrahydrobiopterin dehydratase
MALDPKAIEARLAALPGWRLEGGRIEKTFSFSSYPEGVAFALRVALDAERHDHHPDELAILWKKVRVAYVTHSAGGVTEKDLEAAARIQSFAPA